MVQYTTAMKLGTADTEDILRRFTRDNAQHPTYRVGGVGRGVQNCIPMPVSATARLEA
jgi:TnpA family transposase